MLARPVLSAFLILLASMSAHSASVAENQLRIRLFASDEPAHLELLAEGGSVSVYIDQTSTPIGTIDQGERAGVYVRDEELYAALPEGGIYATSLRMEPSVGTRFRVTRVNDRTVSDALLYEGVLEIRVDLDAPNTMLVVNEVDLETYVAAVVHREYGLDQLEGAKAVAVAARTYALRVRGRFGPVFDVRDDEGSQVYQGAYGIRPMARQAAEETSGEVLSYSDQLIEALHFASSGGHTVDNERVWRGAAQPYLRGKPDPFDENPERVWQSTLPRDETLAALSSAFGLQAEGFVVSVRGMDGRADSINLLVGGDVRKTVSGNAFRLALNRRFGRSSIKSTNFTAVRRDDVYLFEGAGSGHGVGLPQWSAYGMAARGHTYQDILAYYYPGTRLRRLDELPSLKKASVSIPPFSEGESAPPEPEVSAAQHAPSIPTASLPAPSLRAPGEIVGQPAPSRAAGTVAPESGASARIGW